MASLLERLQAELKTLLKAGDKDRLGVVRLVIADVKREQLNLSRDQLTPAEEQAVLQRAAKARRDAIEQAEKANRQDIVTKEKYELSVILDWLPRQMSDEEITAKAREMIAAMGLTKKDMGRFMKEWQGKYKDVSDGRTVQRIAQGLLP